MQPHALGELPRPVWAAPPRRTHNPHPLDPLPHTQPSHLAPPSPPPQEPVLHPLPALHPVCREPGPAVPPGRWLGCTEHGMRTRWCLCVCLLGGGGAPLQGHGVVRHGSVWRFRAAGERRHPRAWLPTAWLRPQPAPLRPALLPQVRGWRGFAQAEWWYIILSLASKQLLAWITYGAYWRYCWVLLGDREEPRAGGRGRCAGSSLDAGWFWRGVPGALSTKVCRGLVCGR
jgi:hypothetical protein